MLEAIYTGMADSGPKVPVEATKVLTEVVAAFGIYALPLKQVAGKCVGQLGKPDKKVQEASQKLLGELAKWMGQPCLAFAFGKLSDKAAKEVAAKLEGLPKPSEAKAERVLKVPFEAPEEYEFDDDGNLVIDLVEPVDMLANLAATEYKEKIKAEKWNEKVAAMDMVIAACGSPPKLMAKDYNSVIAKLAECSKDKMIAVAIAAFNTIGVVAEGMGPAFSSHGKGFANEFLE